MSKQKNDIERPTKWQNAKFLIDSKEAVDSMLYIVENIQQLRRIDLYQEMEVLRSKFYINLANLLDDYMRDTLQKKKDVCEQDSIVSQIYYHRDKHYAHTDLDYVATDIDSIENETEQHKTKIQHIRELCKNILPENITLDFVPHDRVLFRLINNLPYDKEEEIRKSKHVNYGKPIQTDSSFQSFEIFHGDKIFQNKALTEINKEKCGVLLEEGISPFEGVQNGQQFCIRLNVLYKEESWCSAENGFVAKINLLRKEKLMDEFGRYIHMQLFNVLSKEEFVKKSNRIAQILEQ